MTVSMQAIDRALEMARQPKQLTRQAPHTLPPDILNVIKCAAGDENTLAKSALERNTTQDCIRDAARIYLQHIVTHSNGSDRMVLGLPSGATAADIREHKRWMLKWLHPDRNPSKWETNLFHRVKEASERLENGAAHEPIEKKQEHAFQRRRRQAGVKVIARQRPPLPKSGFQPQRLRKRDILRLILGPAILALCVAAITSFVWFRFGPRGGF